VDEEFSPPARPAPIAGVGAEALYRPYAVGKGGTIIARQGASVVTIVAPVARQTLVAMGKLVVLRL
jgi:hypothetical protein